MERAEQLEIQAGNEIVTAEDHEAAERAFENSHCEEM